MKTGDYIDRIKAQREAYKQAFAFVSIEMMRGGCSDEIFSQIEIKLNKELKAIENHYRPKPEIPDMRLKMPDNKSYMTKL